MNKNARLFNLPSLTTFQDAARVTVQVGIARHLGDANADDDASVVVVTAEDECGPPYPIPLKITAAWGPGDHLGPRLEPGTYSFKGWFQGDHIVVELYVLVGDDGVGRILQRTVHELNLRWAVTGVPSTEPAPLSKEDERILQALSREIYDWFDKDGNSLTVKASNALTGRYQFIWQVAEEQFGALINGPHKLRGFGRACQNEITQFLQDHGLRWGMDLTRFRGRLPQPT